jgi:hypothetical protein
MTGGIAPTTPVSAFQRVRPVSGSSPHTIPSGARSATRPGPAATTPVRSFTSQAVAPVARSIPRTAPSRVATKSRDPSVARGPSMASSRVAVHAVSTGKTSGGSTGRPWQAAAESTAAAIVARLKKGDYTSSQGCCVALASDLAAEVRRV